MRSIDWPVDALVPHGGRMNLLDRAISGDDDTFISEADIRADNPFISDSGEVGGWVGIEYMAITVAAWAGWHARLQGGEPRVGFLVGCRRYSCSRAVFSIGETLRIEIHRQFQADNGLAQFDCNIVCSNGEAEECLAEATLTVFEPADLAAYQT